MMASIRVHTSPIHSKHFIHRGTLVYLLPRIVSHLNFYSDSTDSQLIDVFWYNNEKVWNFLMNTQSWIRQINQNRAIFNFDQIKLVDMPENTSNQSDYHSVTKAMGICRYMERPHIAPFFKDQRNDQNATEAFWKNEIWKTPSNDFVSSYISPT